MCIRAYLAPRNIFAKWAGVASLAAIHAIGRIHHKLSQDRIPGRLFHKFPLHARHGRLTAHSCTIDYIPETTVSGLTAGTVKG
jgi:hypothetical protein